MSLFISELLLLQLIIYYYLFSPLVSVKYVLLHVTDIEFLQAIAGEAGVPFFYRAGSEFEEM